MAPFFVSTDACAAAWGRPDTAVATGGVEALLDAAAGAPLHVGDFIVDVRQLERLGVTGVAVYDWLDALAVFGQARNWARAFDGVGDPSAATDPRERVARMIAIWRALEQQGVRP